MKKRCATILLLYCMIVGVSTGCSEKTEINQSAALSAESETAVTLTPTVSVTATEQAVSETASPTVEAEQIDSATAKETAKEIQYAKWEYDKKTHCLTISGAKETHDDAYARDGQGEFWFNNFDNPEFSGSRKEVKEIVIKQGVSAVNTAAFAGFTNLEKVTIPTSVKKLGPYVFYECEALKELVIPDGVESIGKECFFGCKSLKKITFGKKISKIGNGSFVGCESLRNVMVKSGNQNLITENGILYHKKKKILYFAYNNSENVTIADGTKKIGICAFCMNPNLRTVSIPASVTEINGGAFSDCKNLQKVSFAKNSKCKIITDYDRIWDGIGVQLGAFNNCQKLKEIIFPDSLEYIDDLCFHGCSSLKKVYFGKNFKGYCSEDSSELRFYTFYESLLEEVVVSEANKNFSSEKGVMFDKKKEILYIYPCKKNGSKYVVPQNVDKIEYTAFYKCKNLKSLVIQNVNTKIDNAALRSSKHVTIYGKKNSTAEKFAEKKKIKFIAI